MAKKKYQEESTVMSFRATPQQAALMSAVARKHDMSRSEMIRELMFAEIADEFGAQALGTRYVNGKAGS